MIPLPCFDAFYRNKKEVRGWGKKNPTLMAGF